MIISLHRSGNYWFIAAIGALAGFSGAVAKFTPKR
jgi:hypothetical protein